jgi:alpha-L-fucosidase 2
LIFNGQESDAENIINKEFIKGPHGMKYLSLGSLFLTHPDINDNNVRNYRRELDLKTALSTVTFEHQGVNYKRITFASIPNDIIIMRMEADRKSSFNIGHKCDFNTSNENSQGGIVYKIQGVGHEGINPKLTAELLVKVIESDGMTNYSNGGVQVNNYTYATVLINAATNYVNYNDVSGDASAKIKNCLINAEK